MVLRNSWQREIHVSCHGIDMICLLAREKGEIEVLILLVETLMTLLVQVVE